MLTLDDKMNANVPAQRMHVCINILGSNHEFR